MKVGIIVETAEAREVHHMCALLGECSPNTLAQASPTNPAPFCSLFGIRPLLLFITHIHTCTLQEITKEKLCARASLSLKNDLFHPTLEKICAVYLQQCVKCMSKNTNQPNSSILGYGADAICPYLTFELTFALRNDNIIDPTLTDKDIYEAYQKAIETGLAKVMAKVGISTLQSYKGAQIFEAVGMSEEVVEKCFKGTQSRIGEFYLGVKVFAN